ncbi:hypothetical protein BDZ91DRAFT_778295 [Kalaharituber pfeilii]|nr:hypothetical protein BDZ91DRAFT_778295 [Kalaharituber pfeilii]
MPKQFRQRNISKKQVSSKKTLQTADEFIQQGIELEESGDRWRAGDKPKDQAGRFYIKAIAAYESALALQPNAADAAYNLARLQVALGTNEALLPPGVYTSTMLQQALTSHLRCLALPGGQNTTVGNTAQVYVALAEDYSSKSDPEIGNRAVEYLLKGMSLFDQAFRLQEAELQPSQIDEFNMDDDEDDDVSLQNSERMETVEKDSMETERWALIREPVTKLDLLDTVLAKLEALTLFCGLGNSAYEILSDPFAYANCSGDELLAKLETLLQELPFKSTDAFLAKANYVVAIADLGFRSRRITSQQYTKAIRVAFDIIPAGPVHAVNKAEAYVQLAQSLQGSGNVNTQDVTQNDILSHYTVAAKLLTSAAAEDKQNARLHCLRGDVDMWRSQVMLGISDGANRTATIETLWGNAGVYYRGAKKASEVFPEGQNDLKFEAGVKEWAIELQKIVSRGSGDLLGTASRAVREFASFPGWEDTLEDAVRIGVFDTAVLLALKRAQQLS